ncbi:MAG TPA: S9 family peptidase [Blastocatellia bacterium]|nr:S9 family peptidase [Blastocatellia bacterium]
MLSKSTRCLSLALITAIAIAPVLAQSAKPEKITLEDLLAVEGLGGPVLSPDGTQFAMVRNEQIVLMPSEGGWPVTLTTTGGGKSGVAWSPDGKMLAYASQGGIWVVDVRGGEPKRLTNAPAGAGDPRGASDRQPQWSPKGNWILYETGRRGNNDLMIVSADGLTSSYLTSTDADEGSAAWSPDGTRVSYTERAPQYFSGRLKILSFDAATGRAKGEPLELYTAPVDRGGGWIIGRAAWTPDGKNLAVVLQNTGWDKVHLIPAAGGAPKQITTGEWDDDAPVFSRDGKWMAVVSNQRSREERSIRIIPVGEPAAEHAGRMRSQEQQLVAPNGPGFETNPQWSPDASKIYFIRSSPLETPNLMVVTLGAPSTTKSLTRTLLLNFGRAGFRMPERVSYKSKDELEITAMLYKPVDFKPGTRYPTVLWIHGGPEGQDGFNWDPWALYLSQEGYVVLEPNYRGSTGYGEKFRNLNVEDSGGGEMDDVAAGAQYLISEGISDAARIAIGGGSHGGTMVAYAVTKYPDMFRCAIELYGVVDRATYNERTNRNAAIRWMTKMGGTPEEKPQVYRKANALEDVAKIKTPLLIMHGEQDPQVPPYESAQFVAALKAQRKPHWYFTYPGEGHGFSQRAHRLDAWKKQLSFLRKYLQPSYGQSITATDDFVWDKK